MLGLGRRSPIGHRATRLLWAVRRLPSSLTARRQLFQLRPPSTTKYLSTSSRRVHPFPPAAAVVAVYLWHNLTFYESHVANTVTMEGMSAPPPSLAMAMAAVPAPECNKSTAPSKHIQLQFADDACVYRGSRSSRYRQWVRYRSVRLSRRFLAVLQSCGLISSHVAVWRPARLIMCQAACLAACLHQPAIAVTSSLDLISSRPEGGSSKMGARCSNLDSRI